MTFETFGEEDKKIKTHRDGLKLEEEKMKTTKMKKTTRLKQLSQKVIKTTDEDGKVDKRQKKDEDGQKIKIK